MTASLWEFSLELYGRPGVQSACLSLQEDMGMDVNILLYCCWRGPMETEELESLMTKLGPWQRGVVSGLRTVRQLIKPMIKDLSEHSEVVAQLRTKIAGLELEAEKLQQSIMMHFAAGYATNSPPSPHSAEQNLAQYCRLLGKLPDSVARKAMTTVIRAAYNRDG